MNRPIIRKFFPHQLRSGVRDCPIAIVDERSCNWDALSIVPRRPHPGIGVRIGCVQAITGGPARCPECRMQETPELTLYRAPDSAAIRKIQYTWDHRSSIVPKSNALATTRLVDASFHCG